MSKFFEIFGKVMLVIIILGLIVYFGFYLGKQTKTVVTSTPTPEIISPTYQPTSTPIEPKIVATTAGVPKSAGLSFDQYNISFPEGWIYKKESQTTLDEKLVLSKDVYEITIFQAATGGALCLYPNDPPFEGPSSKYELFTSLTTKDGRSLRRSSNTNELKFTICQKSPDNSYQEPTNYGHITIKIPVNYTKEMLSEIDSILSSLKKI